MWEGPGCGDAREQLPNWSNGDRTTPVCLVEITLDACPRFALRVVRVHAVGRGASNQSSWLVRWERRRCFAHDLRRVGSDRRLGSLGGSGASRSGPAPLTLGSDRVSRGSFATRACLPRSRPRAVALARQRRLDPWLRPTALAGAALAPCCWGCRRLLLAESPAAGSPARSVGSARSVGLAHPWADSRTSGTSRSGMLTEL